MISGVSKVRARPKKIAEGWTGFAGRLRYALGERQRLTPELTQNDVAKEAGIDSGQLTKILGGKRALGATANTVLLLAEALDVRVVWLMTGQEPSGLPERREPELHEDRPPRAANASR